ncbi:META domain-containing protein [Bizionia argentinensis JUB59]|uniref:META domain-containing protein n=1 Tax=Bizionia argentinensis JUB59 TaxID=1046627 RepID=G2ED03_9FLAO|nr:copper resistance protein NlpE N-terminal domain-containing protein [Bizionia argentinensis]EGV43803.1 META domain-containing protein [Bizionia argentinensis JUB59]
MKKHLLVLAVLALIFSVSCENANKKENTDSDPLDVEKTDTELKLDIHTSQTSLDWKGTYVGTLPCADCEGIKTTIRLNEDLTYDAVMEYLGKEENSVGSKGYYKWSDDGLNIILSDDTETQYKVGENQLIQLDKSGNLVTGELADLYILKKQKMNSNKHIAFTDTKWKLVQLMGKEINDSEAFISFSTEESKVFGHAGCNTFSGKYAVENGSQISLDKVAVTMMACPDMTVEKQFMEVLNTTDNFSLQGNTMTLNKAKMAPLAVFEAVE